LIERRSQFIGENKDYTRVKVTIASLHSRSVYVTCALLCIGVPKPQVAIFVYSLFTGMLKRHIFFSE